MEKKWLLIIGMVVLLAIEVVCAPFFLYSDRKNAMYANAGTLYQIDGYQVTEHTFLPENASAGMTVSNTLTVTDKITISFEEKLQKDTVLSVYYSDSEVFTEENSKSEVMPEGSEQYTIDFVNGYYPFLRICIDNEFQLQEIKVLGTTHERDITQFILYILFCILVDGSWYNYIMKRKKMGTVKAAKEITAFLREGADFCSHVNQNIYQFGEAKKITIEKFFVVMALIMGISFSLLIPVAQVPDEPAHIEQIAMEWGIEGLFGQYQSYSDEFSAGNIMGNPGVQLAKKTYIAHMSDKLDYNELHVKFHPNLILVKHFPAAVGLLMGILLHLPIWWSLQLGELCMVVFFALVGWAALRYMPIKKELLCAVMLLPMTIQQCSSFNYDGVLMPVCFFLTAYFLHCRYTKEKVGWRDIFCMLVLLLVIAVIKIPYVLLGAFIFTIPSSKFHLAIGKKTELMSLIKKYWILVTGACIILGGLAGYRCRNIVYGQIVIACMKEFLRYIYLVVLTLLKDSTGYIASMVGNLGWLDTMFPYTFIIFALLILLILSQGHRGGISAQEHMRDRIISGGIFLVITVLLLTVMVTWSMIINDLDYGTVADIRKNLYEIKKIEGVQGRYFIPILPCAFGLITGIRKIDYKKLVLLQAVYYGIYIIISFTTVLERYWIA